MFKTRNTQGQGMEKSLAIRSKSLTARVIGFYRMLNEELLGSDHSIFKNDVFQSEKNRKDWDLLKMFIMAEVRENILSEEAVRKVCSKKDSVKEDLSLGDIIFSKRPKNIRQSLMIRLGNAIEKGIKNFCLTQADDVSEELETSLSNFFGRKVQLDLALKKDDNYILSEIKTNFNLDTEKTRAIVEKLDTLDIFLKDYLKGTDNTGSVVILCATQPYASSIKSAKPELSAVKNKYVVGYIEFFNVLGLTITEKMWQNFCDKIALEIDKTYAGRTNIVY